MPTVNEPKLQAPMEAANPAPLQDGKTIVATQPRSEPRPTMENEMTLRGGGMTHYCGFSCCKGRCNFRLC
ncbi:uncharacterized protein B0H64DRAFT_446159 [Chaetomium fimeti]|uniref:Uncharacterized protein n=1 Tax=Chaetomium fimeti TaxID=1854472 RepID=A0AAE0LN34_9PEZI|nr:hypothetical protein B0H64DRAFT_446159 [Chaetomium fimeti]